MKILISNDDSIHAPGIALLAKVAMEFGEVTVMAPAQLCCAMSSGLCPLQPAALRMYHTG